MNTNLPSNTITDSATPVKTFFNNYYTKQISYPADQIDAITGFFESHGFDKNSSNATTIVILQQAHIDDINPMTLLDTLNGLTDIQLSSVVSEVMNYNRQSSSILGYKNIDTGVYIDSRNILV